MPLHVDIRKDKSESLQQKESSKVFSSKSIAAENFSLNEERVRISFT